MIVGARTGAWAKAGGGVPTARDYVQDGLWLQFDAIENNGFGSYDYDLTYWKDNISGIVLNQVNGKFRFTGNAFEWTSLDRLRSVKSEDARINFTSTVQTLEVVTTKANPVFTLQGINGFDDWVSSRIGANSDGAVQLEVNAPGDGLTYLAMTADGEQMRIYINGVNVATGGVLKNSYSKLTNPELIFNGNVFSSGVSSGKVCAIRHSTSCFTPDQVAANYAIDKVRYNLPWNHLTLAKTHMVFGGRENEL